MQLPPLPAVEFTLFMAFVAWLFWFQFRGSKRPGGGDPKTGAGEDGPRD